MNCIFRGREVFMKLHIDIYIDNEVPVVPSSQYVSQILRCICRAEKIMIIPFGLLIHDKNGESGHANLLIYRKNSNQLEHFEPHGDKYRGRDMVKVNETIDAYLDDLVEQINEGIRHNNEEEEHNNRGRYEEIQQITLVKANNVCPRIRGVQALEGASTIPKNLAIEPGGYCSAWSMFFTELCLKNPEIPSRQIYEEVMKKTELYSNQDDYLRNIIRGYTCFINNKLAKHYSQIFGEPITSVKIHTLNKSFLKHEKHPDINNYFEKLLEIMKVEDHGPGGNSRHPGVKIKYNEFTQGIRRSTSSSSLKDDIKVSPPKAVTKVSPPKATTKKKTSSPKTGAKSKAKTAKMNPVICTHPLVLNKKTGICEPCPPKTYALMGKCEKDRVLLLREKEAEKLRNATEKASAKQKAK